MTCGDPARLVRAGCSRCAHLTNRLRTPSEHPAAEVAAAAARPDGASSVPAASGRPGLERPGLPEAGRLAGEHRPLLELRWGLVGPGLELSDHRSSPGRGGRPAARPIPS